jgi:hypothetical protein
MAVEPLDLGIVGPRRAPSFNSFYSKQVLYKFAGGIIMFFGEVIEGDVPCPIRPDQNTHRQNLLIFLLELSISAGKS